MMQYQATPEHTMTTSHTPTPWKIGDKYVEDIYAGNVLIARVNCGSIKSQADRDTADADAAHIVHCVNVHDDLCKALLDMLSGPSNPEFWANGRAALEKAME